jgi:hypothetical protein
VNPIFSAALEVQSICQERGWRFCFIGGIAVQRWGEPRLTQDVDLTILTGFGSEAPFVDSMLERLKGRLPDARAFALRNRVLLLESSAHIPIDVALGAMPFEERAVQRSTDYPVGDGVALRICSAEDLVVFKVFSGRERDWIDVEGIANRQGGSLDTALVLRESKPLLDLKGENAAFDRLREMLERGK